MQKKSRYSSEVFINILVADDFNLESLYQV